MSAIHQYIERENRQVRTENLCGHGAVTFLYSQVREWAPAMFRLLTRPRISSALAFLNFESYLGQRYLPWGKGKPWHRDIDLTECLDDPDHLDTLQKLFERKIRYWQCRPMQEDPRAILSPADAKMLVGSLEDTSNLFIKGKFFDLADLLGENKKTWLRAFEDADFAVFRLTPDKYHYNHVPVSGRVVDFYRVMGGYHSCNPAAVVSVMTPYSKNRRDVTIINTDVADGSMVGLVAMVEVSALMIGEIVQCYSEKAYDSPRPIGTGMFIQRGCPKSLFRPGSSTDVLFFQKGRVKFCYDLVMNMFTPGVESIFSKGFGRPLAETEVKVRSAIGYRQSYSEGSRPDQSEGSFLNVD